MNQITFKVFDKLNGERICQTGPDYRLRMSILASGKLHWSVVFNTTQEIVCSSANKNCFIDLSIQ